MHTWTRDGQVCFAQQEALISGLLGEVACAVQIKPTLKKTQEQVENVQEKEGRESDICSDEYLM